MDTMSAAAAALAAVEVPAVLHEAPAAVCAAAVPAVDTVTEAAEGGAEHMYYRQSDMTEKERADGQRNQERGHKEVSEIFHDMVYYNGDCRGLVSGDSDV